MALFELDFTSPPVDTGSGRRTVEATPRAAAPCNAIAVWSDYELQPGLWLDCGPSGFGPQRPGIVPLRTPISLQRGAALEANLTVADARLDLCLEAAA